MQGVPMYTLTTIDPETGRAKLALRPETMTVFRRQMAHWNVIRIPRKRPERTELSASIEPPKTPRWKRFWDRLRG